MHLERRQHRAVVGIRKFERLRAPEQRREVLTPCCQHHPVAPAVENQEGAHLRPEAPEQHPGRPGRIVLGGGPSPQQSREAAEKKIWLRPACAISSSVKHVREADSVRRWISTGQES